MEEEFKKKGLMRAPVASNIRSKRTIVDANCGRSLLIRLKCVFLKNPHFYLKMIVLKVVKRQQRDLNQPELEEEICEPLNVKYM
ncbi:hypothetical protein CFP56_002385 [Quercus suber]|uniref:Uncharacterized protein n=1 Tax=Quercus suber TaxID=58331 RepID=A0AAW0LFT3_QUESU